MCHMMCGTEGAIELVNFQEMTKEMPKLVKEQQIFIPDI